MSHPQSAFREPARAEGLEALGNAPRAPRSILVVKPSSLGDVVHALPAVALVKRHWPDARLQWLINSEWSPLLAGNPHVDEVIDFPRRAFRGLASAAAAARWAIRLRRRASADLILDFQGLFRSALLSRLCRPPEGRIVGLSDAREGARYFYDAVADVSQKPHAVDRYLALVASLGITLSTPLEWALPEGTPPVAGVPDHFVLLHPYARGRGKSLSPSEVRDFCQALAPLPVVIAGRGSHQAIRAANVTDLVSQTTLLELIWLIRRASFVVSVDSGPMHIAAAITGRLLSLHTWSDPRRVGPFRQEAWVWQHAVLRQVRHLDGSNDGVPASNLTAVASWVASQL